MGGQEEIFEFITRYISEQPGGKGIKQIKTQMVKKYSSNLHDLFIFVVATHVLIIFQQVPFWTINWMFVQVVNVTRTMIYIFDILRVHPSWSIAGVIFSRSGPSRRMLQKDIFSLVSSFCIFDIFM